MAGRQQRLSAHELCAGVVRSAGGRESGCGGAGGRRAAVEIWRVERAREPVGAPAAAAWGGTGSAGGDLSGTWGGVNRGAAGDPQSRGRVRAGGCRISARATGLHAAGGEAAGAADRQPDSRDVAGRGGDNVAAGPAAGGVGEREQRESGLR